jgi:hypothetical protein
LQEYVQPKRIEEVLQRLLNIALLYVDATDTYSSPLQLSDRKECPPKWVDPKIKDCKLDIARGKLSDLIVRFRPGALGGSAAAAPTVPGLIVDETSVVLRTDSILGEALLGQADALDPYGLALQEEDIRARSLNNRKLEIALAALEGIAEPADRATAYEAMFAERPSIEIQSAVSGSNGSAGRRRQ